MKVITANIIIQSALGLEQVELRTIQILENESKLDTNRSDDDSGHSGVFHHQGT